MVCWGGRRVFHYEPQLLLGGGGTGICRRHLAMISWHCVAFEYCHYTEEAPNSCLLIELKKPKAEAPVADFEWCVEVEEARPHVVIHGCCRHTKGVATLWCHSHGTVYPATHFILMPQYHSVITSCFGSSEIWDFLCGLWMMCWGVIKAIHCGQELL